MDFGKVAKDSDSESSYQLLIHCIAPLDNYDTPSMVPNLKYTLCTWMAKPKSHEIVSFCVCIESVNSHGLFVSL